MFGGVGGTEILVIILVIVVFFGADKIPELARGVGKGMSEFRKASDSIQKEIHDTKESFSEPPVKQHNDTYTKEEVVESEETNRDQTEIKNDNAKNN